MRREARLRQQGVALLMVLIALTIIGAMTADLMEGNEVYLATTVNARDTLRAEYLARSGVNLSRLVLSFQRLLGNAVNFPFWQYTDLLVEMFTSDEGGGGLADLAGLDLSGAEGLGLGIADSDLKVTVVDEDSKINVNVANEIGRGDKRQKMIEQLAALMAPPEYDRIFELSADGDVFFGRESVICEMVDWSDPDEDLCDNSGSEDRSVYQMMEPPYERKNAPYDSLDELFQVKGIGDDFWSAFVEPNADDPASRVMTVWGKGQVNVNTAPAQVLLPLVCMLSMDENGVSPCLDPQQLGNLLQIIQGVVFIRTLMPFSKTRDFVQAIESPERLFMTIPGFPILNKGQATQMFTTTSSVFSIIAEGRVGRVTKRIHVVVDMKGEDVLSMMATQSGAAGGGQSVAASGGKILYWRME